MSDENKTPEEELPSSDASAPGADEKPTDPAPEATDPALEATDPAEPDIAAEVAELETALDTPEEAPATTEPDPQAPPAEPDPPAADPPVDPEVDPEAEATVEEAPKRKPRTQAQKDKRKADDARRKTAIAEAHKDDTGPSEQDQAEQDRKDEIRGKMSEAQNELEDLIGACEEKKEELKGLSSQLYPHLVESDHHVDAVRGYIASQKRLRANRAGSPARIKAILEAAGKSPIDAAFSAQRARGMKRPVRSPAAPAATGGDAAPGADKPDADAA